MNPGGTSPTPLKRKTSWSVYFGGGDQVAPAGGVIGFPITSAGLGTSWRYASCVPSGDQVGADGAGPPFVTAYDSPVSIQRT